MRLFSETNSVKTEITNIVSSITLSSAIDQVSETLSFNIGYNEPDSDFYPENPVEVGSIVYLENDEGVEQYRGMVWELEKAGRNEIRHDCYDYMMYLRQNKEVFQFNKQTVEESIILILEHYRVEYGDIASMTSIIDKWYYSKTPLEIINDLLEFEYNNTGKKFYLKQSEGKLNIVEQESDKFELSVSLFEGDTETYTASDLVSDSSYSESIEDLKNSVKVIYQEDLKGLNVAKIKTAETLQDEALVQKFGLLQEVVKIEADDKAKAQHMAEILLTDLARKSISSGVTLLGDFQARAGKTIEVTDVFVGLDGEYLIDQVTHNVNGGIHTMRLVLKRKL